MSDRKVKQENKNNKNKNYVFAVGRRKNAVVRVRLYQDEISWGDKIVNKGEMLVNQKKAEEYFGSNSIKVYREPLRATNTEKKFAITVKAEGGGNKGQLEATALGIARALDKVDREKFHKILRKKGFLTRDPRVRERRKVGMGGKARRKKQSPKR